MYTHMHTRGFASTATIIVIALLALGGGWYAFTQTEQRAENGEAAAMMDDEDAQMAAMEDGEHGADAMTDDADAAMDDTDAAMESGGAMMDAGAEGGAGAMATEEAFSGELLAGSPEQSPLLVFEQDDYEKALASDKLVVLYFFANWCPTCRAEQPHLEGAFDAYTGDDIIGFRVNYNDNATSPEEEQRARDFGVGYQHTKVFLKDGERVLKSPESWEQSRYLEEFSNFTS